MIHLISRDVDLKHSLNSAVWSSSTKWSIGTFLSRTLSINSWRLNRFTRCLKAILMAKSCWSLFTSAMVSGETKACILSTNRKNASSVSSLAYLPAPKCRTSTWWATSIAAGKTAAPTKLPKTLFSNPTQTSLLSIGRTLVTTGLAHVKTLAKLPTLQITSLTTS